MHLLLPWVALTRDFLGLFWCRGVCFVARMRWQRSGGGSFCLSKCESYEPVWPSSPLQACLYLSAGFCLLQCKAGLWGLGSANTNKTKATTTAQQPMSQTTNARGRETKIGEETLLCLSRMIYLWLSHGCARTGLCLQPRWGSWNQLGSCVFMFWDSGKESQTITSFQIHKASTWEFMSSGFFCSSGPHPYDQKYPGTLETSLQPDKEGCFHNSLPLRE